MRPVRLFAGGACACACLECRTSHKSDGECHGGGRSRGKGKLSGPCFVVFNVRARVRPCTHNNKNLPAGFPIVSFHVSQDVMAEAEKFDLQLETKQLAELQESRNELLSRVQSLKKDLQDWRHKLDSQVSTYRSELGELRGTLNSEVEQLRTEFQDLRATLKQQLDATASLAAADEN